MEAGAKANSAICVSVSTEDAEKLERGREELQKGTRSTEST